MYRLYLCNGPQCAAAGCARVRAALDTALWELGIEGGALRSSGCQDHCAHGPNLLIEPGAIRYAGLTAERARVIVEQHLRDGRPVEAWLARPEMRRGAR